MKIAFKVNNKFKISSFLLFLNIIFLKYLLINKNHCLFLFFLLLLFLLLSEKLPLTGLLSTIDMMALQMATNWPF